MTLGKEPQTKQKVSEKAQIEHDQASTETNFDAIL